MRKLMYIFITACLILSLGTAGYFCPRLVSLFQDKREEGAKERIEIDEIVLNYGTAPNLIEKLKLFKLSQPIYSYPLSETKLTHDDAEQKAMEYLVSVLPDESGNGGVYYLDPMGLLFENGETLSVWYVHFSFDYLFEGSIILDDQSGLILNFHINDYSEMIREDEVFLDSPETSELDPAVFAEKLIESYGIPNCKYENGYISIPVSETESIRLSLVVDTYDIVFNYDVPY